MMQIFGNKMIRLPYGKHFYLSKMLVSQHVRSFGTSSPLYDVAIIGGGPGGYVAAIRAAQNGLKTVCIEKRGSLGGTCLNVGCIPSKALLNITHKYHEAKHSFSQMGIQLNKCQVNVAAMQKEKERIMQTLITGIEGLFKLNKVDYKKGEAQFKDDKTLTIKLLDGKTSSIQAKNFIIATGSEPSSMPGQQVPINEKLILTSTEALSLQEIPKKMVIIGGGVIGLEMGSVYKRLGTDVTVVEYLDRITPALDGEISTLFQKTLAKQGVSFMLSTKVTDIQIQGQNSVKIKTQHNTTSETQYIQCDKVLLSIGRRPFTKELGLENVKIEKDKEGRIIVQDDFRVPNYSHIFAIGDVIRGPMLAHKAEEEGIAVADLIAGQHWHVNYEAIPSVVYTHPEVAGVGKTEEDLKSSKIEYKKGVFPFSSNSRARTNNDTEGIVKILTEKSTDKILGAWIIGPDAGELIQQVVLGIEYGASSEDIARTCHAHPTLSEAVKEACMAAHRKPIHGK